MKKFRPALIVLFAVIIVILSIFLVKNKNNDKNKDNDKVVSEIKYMDNKLMTLLNNMNNISLEGYNISVRKTSINKEKRILTNDNEINWEEIKNEVEILYTTIPTMTLDFYNSNINQQEILGFNKELDELTIAIKEENKEQTLIKLANLYRYLPVFISNFSENSEYVNLIEAKSNVFNSYVFVNLDNWSEATNYINKAIDSYSPVLNNLKENSNQYDNQKIYVILNELKSTTNLKDKNVFLIKYRNFLEETQKGKSK